MGTLIDSSVLIAAERGHLDLDCLVALNADDDLAISAVTASELLHGFYRVRTAAQRHRRQSFVEGLLAQLPVIAFDLLVARIHASLWADLAKRGVSVGERDLMIAATGLATDYAVATRDERSFPRIPGLRLERIWGAIWNYHVAPFQRWTCPSNCAKRMAGTSSLTKAEARRVIVVTAPAVS